MARKAKHDQKELPNNGWICEPCKGDKCNRCVDVMRAILGLEDTLCRCKRKNHAGEPRDRQIRDPETGTVYGPEVRVTTDGEVLRGGLDTN